MSDQEPKFKVGDKVTFTNDYGVVFPNKTITKIQKFPIGGIFSGQIRYYFEPHDAYWFPVHERNLSPMIFVFGSNLAGRHGAGAAKFALRRKGAVYGQGVGLHGESYAIPTKDELILKLSIHVIKQEVEHFLQFARLHPELQFQVTRIGCGLAGFKNEEIAPLFVGAPDNCWFDDKWRPIMESEESGRRNDGIFDYKYWGTH